MRAAYFEEFGGPEVIRTATWDVPIPKEDELLIKVSAVSYNYADKLMLQGMLGPVPFPRTLCGDFSGVVTEKGRDAAGWKEGDRVFGAILPNFKKMGCSCESIAVKPSEIIICHAPDAVSLPDAAALTGAGLTAYQGIFEHLQLRKGQTVFIAGGAGGVGHFAVQIAKYAGAYVIASASAGALDLMLSFGADEVFDYRDASIGDFGMVDAAFNAAPLGGEDTNALLPYIRRGGRFVSVYRPADKQIADRYGVWTKAMAVHPSSKDMESLKRLIVGGEVKPYIEKRYPLEDAVYCFREAETGHGKRLIVM